MNLLVISKSVARRMIYLAYIWGIIATVIFVIMAYRGGIPRSPTRGNWEVLVQLGVLGILAIGGLVAMRWRGLGASIVTLSAIGIGALAAINYSPERALLIALVFYIPGLLFWLDWQRTRSLMAVTVLATTMALLLGSGGYTATRVYDHYFGPVQPNSVSAALPPSLVEWIWSGAATDQSIKVNAKLKMESGVARLLVSTNADMSDAVASTVIAGNPVNRGVVSFDVAGLTPNTLYYYAVEVNGAVDTVRQGHFRTMPVGPATFTIAFGSCADTGSNGAVYDTIRELDPILFLSDGDFFYANIAVNDQELFREAFDKTLTSPAQSALYRSVPIAYVWDDHDFGENDANGTAPSRQAAQLNYRETVPHYALPAGDGAQPIYQAFTIGRVRFIITDTRSARSPDSLPDDATKTMLGAEQKAWLKQELLTASKTNALVVWVNPDAWIESPGTATSGWGGYATERQELADFIAENGITNLAMLSGDAHMLAIDDGTNSGYATDGTPGFPVIHAAALDRHGSRKGGPYSEGTYPGGGQFGVMTVVDNGGARVDVIWSGRNWKGDEVVSYQFTVPVA